MILRSWKAYLGIAAVGVLSFHVVLFGPDKNFIQEIASIPFVGALVSALFVLLRDHAAYERALALQNKKNNFVLGASSHMANVAFDKHVEFSEKYIFEIEEAITTLVVKGDATRSDALAKKLYDRRNQYRVWLTNDIDQQLREFEAVLNRVGSIKKKGPMGTVAKVELMRELLGKLVWRRGGGPSTDENTVLDLVSWMRGILGIEELTNLRNAILKSAAAEVNKGQDDA